VINTKVKWSLWDVLIGLMLLALCILVFFRVQEGLHYKWNWRAIGNYLFRYDPATDSWIPNLLILGFFTTIRLSLWATVLATFFGLVMALMRRSGKLFERIVSGTYVELGRNLPPLVIVFIFYFFISDQIMPILAIDDWARSSPQGVRNAVSFLAAPPEQLPAFLSAVVTLAVFEGAYITEIIRAGIESIDKGQWEAARSIGMSAWPTMRRVILPQAVRRILPPLAGQFISTIKDSAIVAVISVQELTFQGMELMAATYLTFEIWITIAVLYLFLTLGCSLAVDRLQFYMNRHLRI
jgi:polar amino acid transport system permease protein